MCLPCNFMVERKQFPTVLAIFLLLLLPRIWFVVVR